MLNLAAQELKMPDLAAAAHLLSQPASFASSKNPTHERFSWPPDQVLEDLSAGYEVRIAQAAEEAGYRLGKKKAVKTSKREKGALAN